MDNRTNTSPISGQLLIYFIIIGVTLISIPKTGMSYVVTRAMQLVEVVGFLVLFIPRVQSVIAISRYAMYVNLWWLVYLFITYSHPHTLGLTPIFWWLHVGVFLLMGSTYWQNDFQAHLKWLAIIFTGLIYLNAILLIIFPEGLWIDEEWVGRGSPVRYLFGNYNQMGFVCLLGLTTHAIYTFYTKKRYHSLYLLMAVSLFSVIFVGSMTSTIGLCILSTYILFYQRIKRPLFIASIFAILYIVVFIFLIWLGNSIEEFSLATDFIENTLQKDTTFSKRTIIWNNAVRKIIYSPYMGYGVRGVEWNDEHLGGSGPHNLWLMLLLQGGIVLCVSFIGVVFYAVRSASQVKQPYTMVAIVALCVLFLMSFFETYNIVHVFFLLQFVYYSSTLPTESSTIEEMPTNSQLT